MNIENSSNSSLLGIKSSLTLIVFLALFLTPINLNCAVSRPVNMVITFDEESEWVTAFSGLPQLVVPGALADAIENNIPVIITSTPLLFNLIVASDTFSNNLKRAQQLNTNFPPESIEEYRSMQQDFERDQSYWLKRNIIGKLTGNNPQWSIYLNNDKDLAILICHTASTNLPTETKRLAAELGLVLDEKNIVKREDLQQTLGDISLIKKPLNMRNFSHLFISNASTPPKRIFIVGHGLEQADTPTFKDSAGTVQKYQKIERTLIAQMTSEEYIEFLKILKNINAEFLYVLSCYAGGINLLKMHNLIIEQSNADLDKAFSLSQIPFTIVIGSTSGTEATYHITLEKNSGTANYLSDFFKLLDQYMEKPRPFLKKPLTQPISRFVKEPAPVLIQDVLKEIYKRFPTSNNIPQVWFTGTTTFRPVPVSDDQFFLTETALRTYILSKQKPETGIHSIIIPSGIKDVLIYPAIIEGISIEFAGNTMPHIISKIEGNSQHFISDLVAKNVDIKDLIDGFCAKISYTGEIDKAAKSWFIDRCICKNYADSGIEDIVPLDMTGLVIFKLSSTTTRLIFQFKGKYYQAFTKHPSFIPSIHEASWGIPIINTIDQAYSFRTISPENYKNLAREAYTTTKPLAKAIEHASAGQEISENLKKAFDEFLSKSTH